MMTKDEKRAFDALYEAVSEIASYNDYPPPPGLYAHIKMTWRRMVRTARRAKAKADAVRDAQ